MRDKRYRSVQALIETGRVKLFREIFDYIPRKVVYTDLGVNYGRFKRLIDSPGNLTITEITTLSTFFEIEVRKIIELVLLQVGTEKKSKRKR